MASKRKWGCDTNNNDVSTENKSKSGLQKYRDSYREAFRCVGPSKKGLRFFYCNVCEDLSCAHGGKDDCRRHVKSKSHTELNELKLKQKPLESFCNTSELDKTRAVTKAEATMCHIITGLNLSLSTADTLTKCFKEMFPDSKIASGMKCGRNKATAMIGEMATIQQENLLERMKSGPFTISTDGSNDNISKQYPMVVRTIDPNSGLVNSELLSVPICTESATGENIFNLMGRERIII